MNTGRLVGILGTSLALIACAAQPVPQPPNGVTMRIGGDRYIIYQLTASTWTLTSATPGKRLNESATELPALVRAIETHSGCKVSDKDFSRAGMQFDAQVECRGEIKN